MSRERHADEALQSMLKAELRHSTQRLLDNLAIVLREMALENTDDLQGFWSSGAAEAKRLADSVGDWG